MTRTEYNNCSKDDFKTIMGYSKYDNYNKAYSFWKPLIRQMKIERPGVIIVLHHVNMADKNYELWKTVPMYTDEHTAYHASKITEETRRKISLSNMGKKTSDETKHKQSLAHKGKKLKEETRLKMSAFQKQKKLREETKQKIRLANIGNKFSEEAKLKMSIAKKGKKASEETKLKMALAHKAAWARRKEQQAQAMERLLTGE